MEKIDIRNFAGLRNAQVEAGPITIFIGPQASGKSVTAKLFFFFRQSLYELQNAAVRNRTIEQYRDDCSIRFSRYFPPGSWGKKAFSITYTTNGQEIRITCKPIGAIATARGLHFSWSDAIPKTLEQLIKRWRKLNPHIHKGDPEIHTPANPEWRAEFNSVITNQFGPWAGFEPIFIPAGRSSFSQIESTIFSTLDTEEETIDPFLVTFGAALERSRQRLGALGLFAANKKRSAGSITSIRSTLKKLLGAQLIKIRDDEFLVFPDGRRVRLAQASSGQQEVLPLLLLLARFATWSHISGRAVYIEEPEAHVFPKTQREIVEFIAETYVRRRKQMCLIVTTHSPYILTSFNNLLEAGHRYATADHTQAAMLRKIIPETQALAPGEVMAYALQDGEARSIIDRETRLIDASVIDDVSTQLAVQFDQLLWSPQ